MGELSRNRTRTAFRGLVELLKSPQYRTQAWRLLESVAFKNELDYEITTHDHDSDYIGLVDPAVAGNFPELTADGELADSGYTAADFAPVGHDHDGVYIQVVSPATAGNFVVLTAGGELEDAGSKPADYALAGHDHSGVYVELAGDTMDTGATLMFQDPPNAVTVGPTGINFADVGGNKTLGGGSVGLYWDSNKVWHEGNDGSGSGLDADTVDTLHAADLALASHTHVEADITDLDHTDEDAIHDNVANEIQVLTEKEDVVNDDVLLIEDSEASWSKKVLRLEKLWENAPAIPVTEMVITVANNSGDAMSAGDIVYVSDDDGGTPEVELADASAEATANGELLMLTENIADSATGTAMVIGTVGGFSGLTAGAEQYLSDTAGEAVEDVSGYSTGDCVRIIGHAISATEIFFNPDQSWVELT